MKKSHIFILIGIVLLIVWWFLRAERTMAPTDIASSTSQSEVPEETLLFQDENLGLMFQYSNKFCLNGPEFNRDKGGTFLDIVFDPCPSNQRPGTLYLDAKVAAFEIRELTESLDAFKNNYLAGEAEPAKEMATTVQGLEGYVMTWGRVDGNNEESYNEGFRTSTRLYVLELDEKRALVIRVFDASKLQPILKTLTPISGSE